MQYSEKSFSNTDRLHLLSLPCLNSGISLWEKIKLTWHRVYLTKHNWLWSTTLFSTRWLQIDYLTFFSNFFPTIKTLSWPVSDYKDKTFMFILKKSSIISPSYDFKNSLWLPSVITNICWWFQSMSFGPPGLPPSPSEPSLITFSVS